MNERGWYCVSLQTVYLHKRLLVDAAVCQVCFRSGNGCRLVTVRGEHE